MKSKTVKSILVIVLLSLVVYLSIQWVRSFLCEVNVKCKNCTRTSHSKEESIKKGFYLMDYRPLNPKVKLTHHDQRIFFTDVWVETQWFSNTNDCLNYKLEKRKGYNIVFEFKKSRKGSFLFSLSPVLNGQVDISNGGIEESKKEIRLDCLTDTLWLQIVEKNLTEGIGWRDGLKEDVIGFVRKMD